MSFCLFLFYRENLQQKMIDTLAKLGFESQLSAEEEVNYLIYPTVMDVIKGVKISALSYPARILFYLASLLQSLLIYVGPIVAQGFIVTEALELSASQSTVLDVLICVSLILPLMGIMVLTLDAQKRVFEYVNDIISRTVYMITKIELKGTRILPLSSLIFFGILEYKYLKLVWETTLTGTRLTVWIIASVLILLIFIYTNFLLHRGYKDRNNKNGSEKKNDTNGRKT